MQTLQLGGQRPHCLTLIQKATMDLNPMLPCAVVDKNSCIVLVYPLILATI
jgi:hypothetical protein